MRNLFLQCLRAHAFFWALGCAFSVHAQVQRSVVNAGFELPFSGARAASLNPFFSSTNFIWVDAGEIPGWETTHPVVTNGCPLGGSLTPAYTCTPIELWANGFQTVTAAQGVVLAELNANTASKLYQNICFANGETFNFNFAHRGRAGADRARFEVGAANTIILDVTTNTTGTGVINVGGGAASSSATGIANGWTRYAGSYTYTGTSGVQRLGFSAVSSAGGISSGNFLDDINIVLKPYVQFIGSATSSTEGASPSAPTIKVVGVVPAGGLVLSLAVAGNATFGSDFDYAGTTALTSITGDASSLSVTVPPGNYSDATANNVFTLPIRTIDDLIIEDNETIVLTMPANSLAAPFVNANTSLCGGAFLTSLTHTLIDNDIDLSASKSVSPSGTRTLGSSVTYTLVYANATPNILTLAPLSAHNAATVTIADPTPAGVSLGAWTCTAVGTTCPAASGTGAISQTVSLPVASTLTYSLQASITASSLCEQTATNISSIATTATSPSGASLTEGTSVQGNASYVFQPNSAAASNAVGPCADLSISKTNGVATLVTGQTTTYAVVLANAGPSAANGAVFKDPATAGLMCTAVSCVAATGAASCASLGTVTLALLQGTGIVLNNFPANSSYSFQISCGVTATGQ